MQRTYYMGFANSAPRPDLNLAIESLDLWTQRSDAAIISNEVPWDSLLSGESVEAYVLFNYKGLTDYYRSKNLKIWVYVDPENGLNRASDADALVAIGKSIAQPAMQQLYRRFVIVMDSIIQPDHLGLALETNLIRGIAPDSVYQGVKQAANAAANDIRTTDTKVKLSVSVQVDYAWGKLTGGSYLGVGQDFSDFPFIVELGLSSYPYFDFNLPGDIPLNYYSRLVDAKTLPVFVSEGGWTSQTINGITGSIISSSSQIQADYINRQSQLLDQVNAIAVFQLSFTDIDLTGLPPSVPSSIKYFVYLGLVDVNFQPKPSLTAWDNIFKRSLKQ
ncbi:MAG TPA: hypothetical protein VMT76_10970 [Puia sp.]|nr:hypothetical protein [Puia sp.]